MNDLTELQMLCLRANGGRSGGGRGYLSELIRHKKVFKNLLSHPRPPKLHHSQ